MVDYPTLTYLSLVDHHIAKHYLLLSRGRIQALEYIRNFALFLIFCALSDQETHSNNYTHHGQSPPSSPLSFHGTLLATTTGSPQS